MRFVIIYLLLSLSGITFAQSVQYAWAKSGLTLRAGSHISANKITTLKYGTQVQLTGNFAGVAEIPIFTPFTVERSRDQLESQAWSLIDSYVEVEVNGTIGWVFAGYLFHYRPPVLLPDKHNNIISWLEEAVGKPTKTEYLPLDNSEYRAHNVYEYKGGITRIEEFGEGGGTNTVIIPLASLNDGFLIADLLWFVTTNIKEDQGSGTSSTIFTLEKADQQELRFREGQSGVSFRVIGNVLTIRTISGC